MSDENASGDKMRLDKWLWAARFFKTRSLAVQAIEHGRVKVGGERVKPARDIRPGDELEIRICDAGWTVTVQALNLQRRPAAEAQTLYVESQESRLRREALREERRLAVNPVNPGKGRPTKRARRQIHRFIES